MGVAATLPELSEWTLTLPRIRLVSNIRVYIYIFK